VLGTAFAINDSGQIVGYGKFNGEEQRAFLLTPIHDSDSDGIPDDEDGCPFSDLSETVIIDSCDSGVDNVLFNDGCSISDLIGECAEDAKNHGQFASRVSHMTNNLKKDGTINGEDKGKIQRCAASADIP
jgi:probable HAF family extracellular repeat protein